MMSRFECLSRLMTPLIFNSSSKLRQRIFMAQMLRTAKSGNDRTINELNAYNIKVIYEDTATFFGTPHLPAPTINPNVMTTLECDDAPDDDTYRIIRMLDLARSTRPAQESVVDDFTVILLRALGYEPRGRILRARRDLPLVICGENRQARADVALIDEDEIILLVQENKQHFSETEGDPQPQLIAEAIATFALNNRRRVLSLGLPTLSSKILASITMMGTCPIFYKIEVTGELVKAVAGGIYPTTQTIVHAHIPAVPRHRLHWIEGMKPLDSRRVILSCFEAFKRFVN
ncbi:hypothetical protein EV401DRAFT_2193535 [Pisolithus croceorrhizus]|nr:hypothetical protein EV401DRAFT_2193535 [Pisolithus croceorrhizus]